MIIETCLGSFDGCGHISFGGCVHPLSGCGLVGSPPTDGGDIGGVQVNGQHSKSRVGPGPFPIWVWPVMMNEIEDGKDWIHFWIWFETGSRVDMEFDRETCQMLHLKDKE